VTIARANDAASLVIYRQRGNAIEVLMGRRKKQARFAPGVYVFPGGMVDAADSKIDRPMPFKMAGLSKQANRKLQTLALTAVRETFEETGLVLGQKGVLPKIEHPSWEKYHLLGMVPALQHLHYLGRAITPSGSATRFHARFFVAAHEHFSGSFIDEGELLDIRWVKLASACELPMFDVTEFMLDEMQRYLAGPRQTTPLMSYRGRHTLIRYENRKAIK
jgi:8-oxo-dGTP pyrophosphatase MutT (NUDIX family)